MTARARHARLAIAVGLGLLALASAATAAPAPRPKLAVMELEDESGTLKPDLRVDLTEYLRKRLAASGRFVLIDSSRQSRELRRLVEDAKKESYKACYDKGCQIPLGKALSADSIVRLVVSEIGGTYVVSAEHIDLAKEAVVGGGLAECPAQPVAGRASRLMSALRSVAEQLGSREGGAAPAPVRDRPTALPPPPDVGGGGPEIETGRVTQSTADLTVSVKPYGKVRLDLTAPGGEAIASGSPYQNPTARPGRWSLLAQAAGHEPMVHEFDVPPDEPTLVKLEMQPLGGLRVDGTPAGAAVVVVGPHDFSHQGGLPWQATGLRLGRYLVKVSRDGYRSWSAAVTVRAGETALSRVALERLIVAAPAPSRPLVASRRAAPEVSAEPAERHASDAGVPFLRFGLSSGLGANICVGNSEPDGQGYPAGCGDSSPLAYGRLAGTLEMGSWFALGLAFDIGGFESSANYWSGSEMWGLGLTLEPRLRLALGIVEFGLGAGVGLRYERRVFILGTGYGVKEGIWWPAVSPSFALVFRLGDHWRLGVDFVFHAALAQLDHHQAWFGVSFGYVF